MDLAYLVYTVGGDTYKFRKIQGRDILETTHRLPTLPEANPGKAKGDVVTAIKVNEKILSACSVSPKLILEVPDPIPHGCVPIAMLPDETISELLSNLVKDSGYGRENAAALDPSSATVEG